MGLTQQQLNRSTLARQPLLQREPLDVGDAIRRVVGLQAQEPASPYIVLWSRVADFDPNDLDTAFRRPHSGQGVADANHPPRGEHRGLPDLPRSDAGPHSGPPDSKIVVSSRPA
jgi:hypothetical protein